MYGECTPEQKQECRLAQHFTDEHHKYYPRNEYRTRTEKAFRNLGENVVQLCRSEHQELHATQDPPEKPSPLVMAEAVLRSEKHIGARALREVTAIVERRQQAMDTFWADKRERRA